MSQPQLKLSSCWTCWSPWLTIHIIESKMRPTWNGNLLGPSWCSAILAMAPSIHLHSTLSHRPIQFWKPYSKVFCRHRLDKTRINVFKCTNSKVMLQHVVLSMNKIFRLIRHWSTRRSRARHFPRSTASQTVRQCRIRIVNRATRLV